MTCVCPTPEQVASLRAENERLKAEHERLEVELAASQEALAEQLEARRGDARLIANLYRALVRLRVWVVDEVGAELPCESIDAALAAARAPGHTDLMISPEAIDETLAAARKEGDE